MSAAPTAPPNLTSWDPLALATQLWLLVEQVNPQEFYWEEAHYDRNQQPGRELLFLLANHDWVRGTSEIIEISRWDLVETAIKIDIDLSQITHEAFRNRTGQVWLPVAMLPPQTISPGREPDPFATVTDAAGKLMPMLPVVDLHHQVSAAMSDIISKMAVAHWPDSRNERPLTTRDMTLLLSAALYRMLGRQSRPDSERLAVHRAIETPRIQRARNRLLTLLKTYIDLLETPAPPLSRETRTRKGAQFAPELAERALKVLSALTESTIIVVPMDYNTAPTVLTARLPPRNLEKTSNPKIRNVRTWVLRPAGRLEIAVLLPTADADRQVEIHLPSGVSIEQGDRRQQQARAGRGAGVPIGAAPPAGGNHASERPATSNAERRPSPNDRGALPSLDIDVAPPPTLADLAAVLDQLLPPLHPVADLKPGPPRPDSITRAFADLAQVKAAVALETLRHYQLARDIAPGTMPEPAAAAEAVATQLGKAGPRDHAWLARLRETRDALALAGQRLSRRTSADPLSPRTVVARAAAIEDVSQRATPTRATLTVDVTVEDRDYLGMAWDSALMSFILMSAVTVFLGVFANTDIAPAPEVLAIVLTLFATIQATRIERPDRTTLQGQLSAVGSRLTAISVLPAVILAVALAFRQSGWPAFLCAIIALVAQALFLGFMRRGPLMPSSQAASGKRHCFVTEKLDYRHFEALRSGYWRSTTAEALVIGRTAYGYVVWQCTSGDKDPAAAPKLLPLLGWPTEVAPSGGAHGPLTTDNAPTWAVADEFLSDHSGSFATDESSSVLALLRAGTQHQATTFVVFRGKPPKTWAEHAEVRRELHIDPDRLSPMDSITSAVDVFVGVCCDEMYPISAHPLAQILRASTKKLIVLEAQLPVPPPIPNPDGRNWARVRLALRDGNDIQRLAEFLDEVHARMRTRANSRHLVAVQTVAAAAPELISGVVPDGEIRTGLLLSSELDVVNTAAINGAPGGWRLLAMTIDARSNVESDMVELLAKARPQYHLAGVTYAVLHGTAMLVVLVHDPHIRSTAHNGLPVSAPDASELQTELRDHPSWAKLQIPVHKQLTSKQLTSPSEFPMLKGRFRWQDRPGAFRNILSSIGEALNDELWSVPVRNWSISYARLQVATGRVGFGHLAIRLHVPTSEVAGWNEARMDDIRRTVGRLAALKATDVDGQSPAVSDPVGTAEPAIRIERIERVTISPRQDRRRGRRGHALRRESWAAPRAGGRPADGADGR